MTHAINYDMASVINQALEQYGASLSPEGFIQRGDKTLSVSVAIHKNRIRFISANSGKLLASGPIERATVEKFVERFWFWTKT